MNLIKSLLPMASPSSWKALQGLGPRSTSWVLATLVALGMGGCSFFDVAKPPLPGERLTVIDLDSIPEPEPSGEVPSVAGFENLATWPVVGATPDHAPGAFAYKAQGEVDDRVSFIAKTTSTQNFQQVLGNATTLYALDHRNKVWAMDKATLSTVWSFAPKLYGADDMVGGIALAGSSLVVTTVEGRVELLNAETGAKIWKTKLHEPLRGMPVVYDDILYQQTKTSKLFALDVASGDILWTVDMPFEELSFITQASPAVRDGQVLAVFSSGDVVMFRGDNGAVLWRDKIDVQHDLSEVSLLADIQALPVVDDARVYVINQQQFVAFDKRNGRRQWQLSLKGHLTPFVTDTAIFVVDGRGYLFCLDKVTGRILWRQPLQDSTSQTFGPYVTQAGVVVISGKRMDVFSIATGVLERSVTLAESAVIAPSFMDGHMYVLDEGRDLRVYN